MKKYIIFYVSNHGFGHLTRCLAIIEILLEKTNLNIYLVSGEKQNQFAKVYLSKFSNRVFFRTKNTDVGLINKKNSLEVDKEKLEEKLFEFIFSWEKSVEEDIKFFKNIDIKGVISDISSIGIIAANQMGVKLIKISNFTWLHQYEYLNINEKIREYFKESYSGIDLFIEYGLSLDHSFVDSPKEKIGFICRKLNYEKVKEIKEKYGEIIFVSCGKSANLPEIEVRNFNGTVIYTDGIKIKSSCKKIKLPLKILDSQNYIAAADIALVKAGWGTIAEGLIGHTPLVLMERQGVLEDTAMIKKLKKRRLALSANKNEITRFDYKVWKENIRREIDLKKLNNIKNEALKVVEIILKNI